MREHSKTIHKFAKYWYYTNLESYKHVYPRFKNLFDDFQKYISPHSFPDESRQQYNVIMPYEHRKYMSESEFHECIGGCMELVDIAEKAYIKYRAAIRDTLYI